MPFIAIIRNIFYINYAILCYYNNSKCYIYEDISVN